jgi:hypothetical protein
VSVSDYEAWLHQYDTKEGAAAAQAAEAAQQRQSATHVWTKQTNSGGN